MATLTPATKMPSRGNDSCDSASVETPGAVQPFGFLIVADTRHTGWPVTRISTNARRWLDRPAQAAIHEPLSAIVGTDLATRIRETTRPGPGEPIALDGMLNGPNGTLQSMTATIHPREDTVVLEIEPAQHAQPRALFRHQCWALDRFNRCEDSLALLQQAAEAIAALAGFSRVMAYRFNADWNGEVLAEVTDGREQRFLGHHFPQSDIPAFVRDLLKRQRLRLIADTHAPAAPLVSSQDGDKKALDLSDCVVRAAAPVHLGYLRNMAVRSSLSLSLVVDGELWGMILCHADHPQAPSQSTRQLCDLLARQAALYLANLLHEEDAFETRALERRLKGLRDTIAGPGRFPDCLRESEGWLLETFHCETMIIRLAGERVVIGRGIQESSERLLTERGAAGHGDHPASSHRVRDEVGEGLPDDWVAGYLFMPISEDGDDYCLWLRGEHPYTITWAGNPHKAVNPDAPEEQKARQSFADWTETVRGASAEWRPPEQSAARAFVNMLQLRIACDYRNLQQREPMLRRLAHNDGLTGLPNRTYLLETLNEAAEKAVSDDPTVVCLFIDLDHFKPINDGYGHSTGDKILSIVGARLMDALRATDTVGRLGGDEFLVVSPVAAGTDWQTAATRLAEKLAAVIQQPIVLGEQRHQLNSSIGVAALGRHGRCAETLLKTADSAMYEAKRNGCNYHIAPEVISATGTEGSPGFA